ncbi:MAG: methylmalonyl-CoA epimerase [Chloroflexota bacterium]|nr:MAG: methylmalonyl-CoA epimerase [Chloroflexota bacterium]
MIKKIDHIGVAVKKIEDALPVYTDGIGLALERVTEVGSEGVKVAFVPAGETLIELLEPTGPSTAVAGFLEKRGEGLHHICFEVDDIDATIADLKGKGVPLLSNEARQGADGRIVFIHPKAGHGVLIELLEKPR